MATPPADTYCGQNITIIHIYIFLMILGFYLFGMSKLQNVLMCYTYMLYIIMQYMCGVF